MTSLLILGNTNQHTFSNSIVAANIQSLKTFDEPLKNIFVFHSPESKHKLQANIDWLNHLKENSVSQDLFVNRVIDLTTTSKSISSFIDHIEFVIRGLPEESKLMVDMTNGTSLQKSLFSVATYVLDIKEQYTIDIEKLKNILSKPIDEIGFAEADELEKVYFKIPDSIQFDGIAYLALSEIVRYKSKISNYEVKYKGIDQISADWQFFKDNLKNSVQLKLQGDKNKDNTLYRISSASIASITEDLISLLIKNFFQSENQDKLMLGSKIRILESELEKGLLPKSDFEFLKKFNDFILYLRNKTTHKDVLISDLEKFKAELSVTMSFPFLEFYIDVIYPILLGKKAKEAEEISISNIIAFPG